MTSSGSSLGMGAPPPELQPPFGRPGLLKWGTSGSSSNTCCMALHDMLLAKLLGGHPRGITSGLYCHNARSCSGHSLLLSCHNFCSTPSCSSRYCRPRPQVGHSLWNLTLAHSIFNSVQPRAGSTWACEELLLPCCPAALLAREGAGPGLWGRGGWPSPYAVPHTSKQGRQGISLI